MGVAPAEVQSFLIIFATVQTDLIDGTAEVLSSAVNHICEYTIGTDTTRCDTFGCDSLFTAIICSKVVPTSFLLGCKMVKAHSPVVYWLLSFGLERAWARSWKDIELLHGMNQPDLAGQAFLDEQALQFLVNPGAGNFTVAPAFSPSRVDRTPSTIAPSPSPSAIPSSAPSSVPSDSPSTAPSSQPTMDPYPQSSLPQYPGDDGYFNYNDSTGYGPNDWGSVGLPNPYYWDEFDKNGFGPWIGVLEDKNIHKNLCSIGTTYQSPIDVRVNNGAQCDEIHEVRDNRGDYKLTDDAVIKTIEANKLRLQYPRRPCSNVTDLLCQIPRPPTADFPNGWKGVADILHIDFKVRGEHLIEGEAFDAEMQIFHIHKPNQRLAALATSIRASASGYNSYLQVALDAFRREYDKNQAKCNSFLRTGRAVGADWIETTTVTSYNATSTSPTSESAAPSDSPTSAPSNFNATHRARKLLPDAWNPYDEMLIPTIYFYRYDGSLTEPPCGEFVSWFISDKPMIVSFGQLEQMKELLFTNVNNRCQKTSVHSDHTVARPIHPTLDRKVWKCTPADFGPDPFHSSG